MDWAVVIATLVGPIVAVAITLWYQGRERDYQRRLAVFSTMMRWRRHIMSVDFVGSLNLVPVEFSRNETVMRRYQELFLLFEDSGWKSEDGEVRARLIDNVRTKCTELLSAMGADIGIKMDQMQILKGAYAPQGWEDEEQLNRMLRHHLASLMRGEIALPVVVYQLPEKPPEPAKPAT